MNAISYVTIHDNLPNVHSPKRPLSKTPATGAGRMRMGDTTLCDGMRWDAMRCEGVRFDAMRWDRMRFDGMGCDAMGWNEV